MLLEKMGPEQKLNYDKDIQIATANTRNASSWKNQTITLVDFVQKLAKTIRTKETFSAYMSLPKSEQDDIKDVGGFVGGLLKGGRRGKGNVANRSILTLDADYADGGTVARIREVLGNHNYTIYSTHKHNLDAGTPRYRLVIATDRLMLPDEYQAVMRKVAEMVNINTFDDSTYDVNRLMYWPSTSDDADFYFEHNDAPFISVDEILKSYGEENAWSDVLLWPTSDRETKRITKGFEKQADPFTKKGVVGAFCRCVSIHEAVMLTKAYKLEKGGRYTYVEGSSSNGLVIYDDKFAYSNHSTDPVYGVTCNAFDLVRVHLFGDLDADAKAATPTHRMPSYSAMVDYAKENPIVAKDLLKSGINDDVVLEFDDISDDQDIDDLIDGPNDDWLDQLQTAEDGHTILTTFVNAVEIVRNDTKIKNLMALNELSGQLVVKRTGELWGANDSYKVRTYIGKRYDVDFPENKAEQAIEQRGYENKFHPIRDYLDGLVWDGVARVDRLFVDWLKCNDNAYTRQAAKCVLVAAVARVFEPGYKFDSVPVLGGMQGIGKTTMVRLLGKGAWYGELSSFDNKIAVEEMQGRWIMEMNEMGATNRHDLEQQKAFISAQSTTVRAAYARRPTEVKRQCVFFATTNQQEYLKDSTGNRRWWPIESGLAAGEEVDLEAFADVVDQLWAEAFTLYQMGESTLLEGEARKISAEIQKQKTETEEIQGVIEAWLEKQCDKYRYDKDAFNSEFEGRDRVCVLEIWHDCLGNKDTPKRYDALKISSIMDNMEHWERRNLIRFGDKYGRQKGWFRTTPF